MLVSKPAARWPLLAGDSDGAILNDKSQSRRDDLSVARGRYESLLAPLGATIVAETGVAPNGAGGGGDIAHIYRQVSPAETAHKRHQTDARSTWTQQHRLVPYV